MGEAISASSISISWIARTDSTCGARQCDDWDAEGTTTAVDSATSGTICWPDSKCCCPGSTNSRETGARGSSECWPIVYSVAASSTSTSWSCYSSRTATSADFNNSCYSSRTTYPASADATHSTYTTADCCSCANTAKGCYRSHRGSSKMDASTSSSAATSTAAITVSIACSLGTKGQTIRLTIQYTTAKTSYSRTYYPTSSCGTSCCCCCHAQC